MRQKNTDVFNENIDQFCDRKKYRFVFNENTDKVCDKKNTDLYLMKIGGVTSIACRPLKGVREKEVNDWVSVILDEWVMH